MTGERFSVRVVSVTKPIGEPNVVTAEELIVYCARVSSPESQARGENQARLLGYCIRKGHWSIFEQASLGVEIRTSRAISAQILRHRSFSFQEFSQRYAAVNLDDPITYQARAQGETNRQGSGGDVSPESADWFRFAQVWVHSESKRLYEMALRHGIARECARMLLPMATATRIYMYGTVRSWIHYLQARCADDTQAEHREIAVAIRDEIFAVQFPLTYSAVFCSKEDSQ